MHESGEYISWKEVDYIVGAEEAKRDPDINHQGDAVSWHFVPSHGQVLRWKDGGWTNMARKVKVIGVEVGDGERVDTRVKPEEADGAPHQEDGLDHVTDGVKQAECAS